MNTDYKAAIERVLALADLMDKADQPRGVTVFVCIGCRMSSLTSTYPCSESALGAWCRHDVLTINQEEK